MDMSFALFMDGDVGEQTGRLVTFIINMVSMAIGFTLIPLLPMPLPYIVAFLVAYATYKEKSYGMFTGSLLISLGLIYHLSRIGFFQIFHGAIVKIIILSLLIAPFAVCPAIITNNLHIIAIDMGILAVSLLFFESTFYYAIPLILVFATVYKGRGIALTFVYYAFISIPLQAIQYLKTYQEGSFPPLYTPLNQIYSDIQGSLSYISMDELRKIFNSISDIFLIDNPGSPYQEAIQHLLNSVPGIIFFLIIMIGFISAITLLNMNMPDPVKESVIPGKYVDFFIYLLPIFVAALTNFIFFISIDNLQRPLAFQAIVNPSILFYSTAFTVLFSAPVSFSKYLFDLREVKEVRSASLLEECRHQQEKLERLISLVNRMRTPVPDNFIDIKTRMLIALDQVKEIKNSTESAKELKEIDENIRKIYNGLKDEIESFETRLDVALRDYYIKTKFEYLEAAGEITDLGLDVDPPVLPDMEFDAPLEEKLDHIEGVIEAGRVLVEKLIDTSDKIYEIISSLFEPSLPKDSATLMISKEKIDEDEPWVIIDAILVSLKNWEKQYSADIVNATRPINDSVETVVQLSRRRGSLSSLLGEKYEEIRELAEHVEARNFSAGSENLRVLKVILIRDTILNTVDVVGKIIGILYYHIKDLEFNINLLLPREDYEWNRNLTLTERMSQSLEVINNYEQYRIDELISHLYRVLSYIDEAVDTIEYYNERKEMLLNYPIFQKKIHRILDEKGEVKLDEIGVSEKYGREYLKMYLRTTYSPVMLEETADSLRRSR